jgi:hypothetical protein
VASAFDGRDICDHLMASHEDKCTLGASVLWCTACLVLDIWATSLANLFAATPAEAAVATVTEYAGADGAGWTG